MDCTASMEPWIQAAKDHIVTIVNKTQQETPEAEVRVAFVGYRDYGDSPQIIRQNFGNADMLLDRIDNVHAKGGHDIAEDVAGGLMNVRTLAWDVIAVKSIVHIADAPPHGMQFHEPWISDRFSQGDPDGKNPLSILQSLSEENIDYTFIKINDSTNIMIKEFHDVYTGPGEFQVMDLQEQGVEEFAPAVFRSVTNSITRYTSSQDPSGV
jgi:hypothetical protein